MNTIRDRTTEAPRHRITENEYQASVSRCLCSSVSDPTKLGHYRFKRRLALFHRFGYFWRTGGRVLLFGRSQVVRIGQSAEFTVPSQTSGSSRDFDSAVARSRRPCQMVAHRATTKTSGFFRPFLSVGALGSSEAPGHKTRYPFSSRSRRSGWPSNGSQGI